MLTTTTTMHDVNATLTRGTHPQERLPNELYERYQTILQEKRLHWTTHTHLTKLLGRGGQGVVYLTERRGADNFTLPVAMKIFSPDRYSDGRAYDEAMGRIAHVASLVAQIQHDNLLDVHNFVDRDRIRIMVMEWVDGYDLCTLLVPAMLRSGEEPGQHAPLGVHQQRDRNLGSDPSADQAGSRRGDRARLPLGDRRAASRRHRPRRRQTIEHHAQAHGQRQNGRYRFGL